MCNCRRKWKTCWAWQDRAPYHPLCASSVCRKLPKGSASARLNGWHFSWAAVLWINTAAVRLEQVKQGGQSKHYIWQIKFYSFSAPYCLLPRVICKAASRDALHTLTSPENWILLGGLHIIYSALPMHFSSRLVKSLFFISYRQRNKKNNLLFCWFACSLSFFSLLFSKALWIFSTHLGAYRNRIIEVTLDILLKRILDVPELFEKMHLIPSGVICPLGREGGRPGNWRSRLRNVLCSQRREWLSSHAIKLV